MVSDEKKKAAIRVLGETVAKMIDPLAGEDFGKLAGFTIVSVMANGDGTFTPFALAYSTSEGAALAMQNAARLDPSKGKQEMFEVDHGKKPS